MLTMLKYNYSQHTTPRYGSLPTLTKPITKVGYLYYFKLYFPFLFNILLTVLAHFSYMSFYFPIVEYIQVSVLVLQYLIFTGQDKSNSTAVTGEQLERILIYESCCKTGLFRTAHIKKTLVVRKIKEQLCVPYYIDAQPVVRESKWIYNINICLYVISCIYIESIFYFIFSLLSMSMESHS